MELIEYKNLAERERFFWWNVGRRHILKDALKRHLGTPGTAREILDVGCGPGGNMLFLKEFGAVTGLDSNGEALRYARDEPYKDLIQGTLEQLPFHDNSFDVVAALDVIEHVEGDTQALKETFRVLKPGGILLVTVPAYAWMWSAHDVVLHHRRRYSRNELRTKVLQTGFSIEALSNFIIPSIPFRAVKIIIKKIKGILKLGSSQTLQTDDVILPTALNFLFILWLHIERYAMKAFSLPFGSSILVIARKSPS